MATRSYPPDVDSVAALLALAHRRACDDEARDRGLAGKMRRLHNGDSARVFDRLADGQAERAGEIAGLARSLDVALESTSVPQWQPDEDEAVTVLLGTDYLMTPYKAFQLAVLEEQQAFSLFSAIAANADPGEIQDRAEDLAHQALETLSLLRADRRLAYRHEPVARLSRAKLNDKPVTTDQVADVVSKIDSVLSRAVAGCLVGQGDRLPEVTRDALNNLQADYPVDSGPASAADDSVAALKAVLMEFEAAVDVCLRISETGRTEAVVAAAHEAAERYLGGLSVVRDQLDYLIHLETENA